MNIVRMLAAAVVVAAIAAIPAHAQGTRPGGTTSRPVASPTPATAPAKVAVPASKIALVDTEAFGDEKVGIVRFVRALQALEREFKPQTDQMLAIQAKMQQLARDIETLSKSPVVDRRTIDAKREEGSRLERELKYKKEEYDAATPKRYRELVTPISQDIGKELDAFRKEHGITLILDVSKLLPVILSGDNALDITAPFIAYYNARHPATASGPAPK
jgi:Skp family chaperone for outer membrane proteins